MDVGGCKYVMGSFKKNDISAGSGKKYMVTPVEPDVDIPVS